MSTFQLTNPGENNLALRSVPLIKRGELDSSLVACNGHKLISVASSNRGVSFFTKYLLLKSYRDASVLFVDSTSTFGEGFKKNNLPEKWNAQVMPFQWIDYESIFLEQLCSMGIQVAEIPLELEQDEPRLINFLINLFEYVGKLPLAKISRVLVLERFWFLALEQPALWDSLNYLLKIERKIGLEIWLLCPIDIYDETRRDEIFLLRLQRLLNQIPNLFLFSQLSVILRLPPHNVQFIWQLSDSAFSV